MLFKYTKPEWAEAMVARGSLHIEYRKVEVLGEEIGDPDEGKAKYSLEVDGSETWTAETMPTFVKGLFPDQLRVSDIAVVKRYDVNAWVYSVSEIYSDEMQRRSEYTACVEIFDTYRFLLTLIDAMGQYAQGYRFDHCRYIGRDLPHDKYVPPALLKPLVYAYQREWRLICNPRNPNPSGFNMVVPGLVGTCRRIR